MTTPELPPVAETSLPNATEKKVDWGFWVWLGCSLVLVLVVAVVGTATVTRYAFQDGRFLSRKQRELIIGLSSPKHELITLINSIDAFVLQKPMALLMNRIPEKETHWINKFPEESDNGYLLFSGVDPLYKQSVVILIRVSDGTRIKTWIPDWHEINKKLSDKSALVAKQQIVKVSDSEILAMHPLLLDNGELVFKTSSGGGLIKMGLCNSEPLWILDGFYHHSNEIDAQGNIWTPSKRKIENWPTDNLFLANNVDNDSISKVSNDGIELYNISFVKVLIDNNLKALLFGGFGENLNFDPIHINQVVPASQASPYWNAGDLLISARGLSTIFIYRPSTNKIVWHQKGPWLNQHSAMFISNHEISIFSNNVIHGVPKENAFLNTQDVNKVIIYDFSTKTSSEKFKNLLEIDKPRTIYQGRSQILSDGGLFVEETEHGRHLRYSKGKLLWSKINYYDENYIGMLSWSRYLTADEAAKPLAAILAGNCEK